MGIGSTIQKYMGQGVKAITAKSARVQHHTFATRRPPVQKVMLSTPRQTLESGSHGTSMPVNDPVLMRPGLPSSIALQIVSAMQKF